MGKFIRFGSVLVVGSLLLGGCGTLSQADQQKTLKSYLDQINKTNQPVTDANAGVIHALTQFDGTNTNDVKAAVTQLENVSAAAENKVPSSPSGFSDNVNTLLNEASNDFTLGYQDAYDAADSLSKYIDSQNPNDMQDYKNKMGKATDYMSQANNSLENAKQEVGIK